MRTNSKVERCVNLECVPALLERTSLKTCGPPYSHGGIPITTKRQSQSEWFNTEMNTRGNEHTRKHNKAQITQQRGMKTYTYLWIAERTNIDVISTNGMLPYHSSGIVGEREHSNFWSGVVVPATIWHAASPHYDS